MSRSYKKNPIIKDNGRSHKRAKKAANQRLRTTVRNIMSNLDSLEDKIFPTARGLEITNQYDICDWINRYSEEPIIWYNYKLDKLIAEYPTKADFRTYKNK